MEIVKVTIEGVAPLLMHNEQMANPLNEHAKELKKLTLKRTKTDEDHRAIAYAEFLGGLYYDPEVGPVIPSRCLIAALREGGKISKKGTAILRGVSVQEFQVRLDYRGPRDPEKLYAAGFADQRSVSAQGTKGGSRTIRTRPMFKPPWNITFHLMFDTTQINEEELKTALEQTGRLIGMGDYRPVFGKFEIKGWN